MLPRSASPICGKSLYFDIPRHLRLSEARRALPYSTSSVYMGVMAQTPETQLLEALKKVDVYGDIAPPHVQDPMTMVLRQNAVQADLIRWDDSRARFVLTGTGRNRITARSRSSGKILRFKMRDEKDGRTPLRKA